MQSFIHRNNQRLRPRQPALGAMMLGGLIMSLLAMQVAAAGDSERGKEKSQTCAACHGSDGNSTNPEWPTLAGQHAKYLSVTLHAYQDGTRTDVLMSGQTSALNDDDIEDLAAYYATQTPKRRTADPALVALGERIYRGGDKERGISACMACHGPSGRGNPASGYPSLAGQHATYTKNQLTQYRANERQSDIQLNQVMRSTTARMTEEEIKAVASYIQGLQ